MSEMSSDQPIEPAETLGSLPAPVNGDPTAVYSSAEPDERDPAKLRNLVHITLSHIDDEQVASEHASRAFRELMDASEALERLDQAAIAQGSEIPAHQRWVAEGRLARAVAAYDESQKPRH